MVLFYRHDCWPTLTALTAGQLDFELRALTAFELEEEGYNKQKLTPACLHLLLLFTEQLRRKTDFELVHAYLAAFLKLHRTELWSASDDQSRVILQELQSLVTDGWKRLNDDVTYDMTVLQWLRSAIVG